MIVEWTDDALFDVARLVNFLAGVAPEAATRVRDRLLAAPARLVDFPRLGPSLPDFEPREIRCLTVGSYELATSCFPASFAF